VFGDGIADQVAKRGNPELEHPSGSTSLKGRVAAIKKHLHHLCTILVAKIRRIGSEKPLVKTLRGSDDTFGRICH